MVMKTRSKVPRALENALWIESFGDSTQGKCCYCKGLVTPFTKHIGHVISHKNGGTLALDNLVILCGSCNPSIGSENFNDFCDRTKTIPLIRKEPKIKLDVIKEDTQLKDIIKKLQREDRLGVDGKEIARNLRSLTIGQMKYLAEDLFHSEIFEKLKEDIVEEMLDLINTFDTINIRLLETLTEEELESLYTSLFIMRVDYEGGDKKELIDAFIEACENGDSDYEDEIVKVVPVIKKEIISLTENDCPSTLKERFGVIDVKLLQDKMDQCEVFGLHLDKRLSLLTVECLKMFKYRLCPRELWEVLRLISSATLFCN